MQSQVGKEIEKEKETGEKTLFPNFLLTDSITAQNCMSPLSSPNLSFYSAWILLSLSLPLGHLGLNRSMPPAFCSTVWRFLGCKVREFRINIPGVVKDVHFPTIGGSWVLSFPGASVKPHPGSGFFYFTLSIQCLLGFRQSSQ